MNPSTTYIAIFRRLADAIKQTELYEWAQDTGCAEFYVHLPRVAHRAIVNMDSRVFEGLTLALPAPSSFIKIRLLATHSNPLQPVAPPHMMSEAARAVGAVSIVRGLCWRAIPKYAIGYELAVPLDSLVDRPKAAPSIHSDRLQRLIEHYTYAPFTETQEDTLKALHTLESVLDLVDELKGLKTLLETSPKLALEHLDEIIKSTSC